MFGRVSLYLDSSALDISTGTAYRIPINILPLHRLPSRREFGKEYHYSIGMPPPLGNIWLPTFVTLLQLPPPPILFAFTALSNGGGTIADIWNARERGLGTALYTTAPLLGPGMALRIPPISVPLQRCIFTHNVSHPVIGPIVGGFVAQNHHLRWRFNFWLMFIFSACNLLFGFLATPETVTPFSS